MTIENGSRQEIKLTTCVDRRRCMKLDCKKLATYELTKRIAKGAIRREFLCRDCLDQKRQMVFVPELK